MVARICPPPTRRTRSRRSLPIAALLILALLLVACEDNSSAPLAASKPGAKAPVSRAAAMEQPEECPQRWPVRGCPGQEERKVKTPQEIYYYDVGAAANRFAPASFALSLSHQIALVNRDSVRHNLTVPASGISLDVEPGSEDFTRPITLEPGRYEFFCRFHRAAGMRGVLTMTAAKDVITLRRGY